MDSLRDWGHANDYVQMQWLMLQQDTPEDFVIATGKQYSVRQFIKWAAKDVGVELEFTGSGVDEIGTVVATEPDLKPMVNVGDVIIRVDERYFRPTEVDTLLGNPAKAKRILGWEPIITAREMCTEMVAEDVKNSKRLALLSKHGLAQNFTPTE